MLTSHAQWSPSWPHNRKGWTTKLFSASWRACCQQCNFHVMWNIYAYKWEINAFLKKKKSQQIFVSLCDNHGQMLWSSFPESAWLAVFDFRQQHDPVEIHALCKQVQVHSVHRVLRGSALTEVRGLRHRDEVFFVAWLRGSPAGLPQKERVPL